MTDYTIAAITYVLIAGFLVSTLLIGGMLVLNLGLLSKRDRDLIGGRNPSDVGILKNTNWPQVAEEQHHLPAMPEESEIALGAAADTDQQSQDERAGRGNTGRSAA